MRLAPTLATLFALAALVATGLAGSLALAPFAPPQQIPWEAGLDAALTRAKAEKKVLFLAVNMDDEPGNERTLRLYEQEAVLTEAAGTVNVLASAFDHGSGDAPCKRFGSVTCAQHKAIEKAIRSKYVETDAKGHVISPQHVFLKPDGKVLLAVSWEISEEELIWCLANAKHKLDPQGEFLAPAGSRAPRRLSLDGEVRKARYSLKPFQEKELKEAIKAMKKDWVGGLASDEFNRLLVTDHKDAIKFVRRELDNGILGMIPSLQVSSLQTIGTQSPASFWEAVVPLLKEKAPEVRSAAAVALEQLAAPKSVKALKGALGKEKVDLVAKNMLRALGTAGSGDKGARGTLLKHAKNKEAVLRRNALLALGSHLDDKRVDEALAKSLAGEDPGDRKAAALALALGRRVHQRADLQLALGKALGEEGALMERVLKVLDGTNLALVEGDIREVARDSTPRIRFFGYTRAK